jgi:hypothetical protein
MDNEDNRLELKRVMLENKYLKERLATLEYERNLYCINEKVYSYQNDSVDSKALMKEIKHLKKRCAKLEEERNYYINEGSYYELFEKYVGLYNKEENTLIVHHFVDNKLIFPYGCGNFEGDYTPYTVMGSWDNWNTEYILKKRCVRDSDGIYEGYVYYIIAENIVPGNKYEFKFKDEIGDWIEPVYDGESAEDAGCQLKLKQNTSGIWNAVITVSSDVTANYLT